MASTSTGYHSRTIVREQPTSSGQVQTFSSGCIQNFNASAELRVQSGGIIDLKSGSIMKSNVTNQTSANKSIPRDGISVIASTIANTMTISSIPQAGMHKEIVCYTTLAQTIRGASSVGVTFGATANKYYSFVVTNTTKTEELGTRIVLTGHSTKRWHISAVANDPTLASTAKSSLLAMSTACT